MGHWAYDAFSLAARFSQDLSLFPGLDSTDTTAVTYVTRLIDFFSFEYLQILESAQSHILYYKDIRVPDIPTIVERPTDFDVYDSSDDETSTTGTWVATRDQPTRPRNTAWIQDISTKTDMHGFDQVITLSHQSIDEQFRTLLRTSRDLLKWSYESFFNATFGPITVRLMSHERAIVWIHLEEAQIKTLQGWKPSSS